MALQLVIGNKNYSSWSLRPWLFLRQMGVPFEEIRLSLFTPQWPETIRRYSPTGQVPAARWRHLRLGLPSDSGLCAGAIL
jgi:glutathione S-transferase